MSLLFFITNDDQRDPSKKACKIIGKGICDTVEFLNIYTGYNHRYRNEHYRVLPASADNPSGLSRFIGEGIDAKIERMTHLLNQEHGVNPSFTNVVFERGYKTLETSDVLKATEFGRWLRNEACVWAGYGESDPTWISEAGVNYDPAHPDNLSATVIKNWREKMNSGLKIGEAVPPRDYVNDWTSEVTEKQSSSKSLAGFNLVDEKEFDCRLKDIEVFLNKTVGVSPLEIKRHMDQISGRIMRKKYNGLVPIGYLDENIAVRISAYLIKSLELIEDVTIEVAPGQYRKLTDWIKENIQYGQHVAIRKAPKSTLPGLVGYSEFPTNPDDYVFLKYNQIRVLNDVKKEAQG